MLAHAIYTFWDDFLSGSAYYTAEKRPAHFPNWSIAPLRAQPRVLTFSRQAFGKFPLSGRHEGRNPKRRNHSTQERPCG